MTKYGVLDMTAPATKLLPSLLVKSNTVTPLSIVKSFLLGSSILAVSSASLAATVPPPEMDNTAYVLMDYDTGAILAEKNADQPLPPASLTKMMTSHIIEKKLMSGELKEDEPVIMSENAWCRGTSDQSCMYVPVHKSASVIDMLRGIIIQSGNDASKAMAEHIAGSEQAFAQLMNAEAKELGMTNTNFVNATGMPDENHHASARDLAILARAIIKQGGDYYKIYSEKEFTYNNITQGNRNALLRTDPTVDGLKTGHTKSAGYGLVTTALRDGRRIVTVVTGTANDAARTEDSLKLLNWSYQNFETVELYQPNQPIVTARIWEGEVDTVGLGLKRSVWVTVPRGQSGDIKPMAHYTQPLMAPVSQDQQVGTVAFSLGGQVIANEPLLALNNVPQAGFMGRMIDKVRMWFN